VLGLRISWISKAKLSGLCSSKERGKENANGVPYSQFSEGSERWPFLPLSAISFYLLSVAWKYSVRNLKTAKASK
jgi:hypothetical protein